MTTTDIDDALSGWDVLNRIIADMTVRLILWLLDLVRRLIAPREAEKKPAAPDEGFMTRHTPLPAGVNAHEYGIFTSARGIW
jgi:hypothetical protein